MSADSRRPDHIVRPLLRVRQTREFEPEVPTDEELGAIADVARWSGSSTNTQPWRFIVIRDREVIARIHEAGMPQTRSLATAPAAIAIVLPDDDDAVS
jgi:nitroreductase